MRRNTISHTAFALVAGLGMGAGAMLLIACKGGTGSRFSLCQNLRRQKDQMDQEEQATKQGNLPTEQGQAGAECGIGSARKDHTEGDTGHDN